MIAVLCSDYQEAIQGFEMLETFLWEEEPPWYIIDSNRQALMIRTDENIDYLFLHHRFRYMLDEEKDDIVDFEDFFGNLEFTYHERHI